MKWCGGAEWKGKVASSVILPDMHVPRYGGTACANSTNFSVNDVFAYWLLIMKFLAFKDEFYAGVITDDLT